MANYDEDPFVDMFGRFQRGVDESVAVPVVTQVRGRARRRRNHQVAGVAVVVAVLLIAPAAAYSALADGFHRTGVIPGTSVQPSAPDQPSPTGEPSTAPSTTPSSAPPSAPSTASSPPTSTITHAPAGTLTFLSRAGATGNQQVSTFIRVDAGHVTSASVGEVANFGEVARQVGFAPDGQHIVFMDPATGSLDVSAPDGTKLSHIGAGPIGACGSPIWSPDGQRIVYAQGIGKPQIIVVNQDGTHRQVVGAGCYPIFSTDGSQIAYIDSVGKMDLVNLDGTGHRVVPTHLGTTRIRTITSVSHGRAIIEVPPPSSCGCDEGLRNLRLSRAYVVDLATGATSDLPTNHGKIYSAFLTADGGMVLRTWTGDGTKPGTVVILAANGSVRAMFDESTLSTNGAKVNINLMDLVGYTP